MPRKRRAPSLNRRRAFREPQRRFYVFAEGLNTEPEYLRAIERLYDNSQIEIVIEGGVGAPKTIANTACAKAKELKRAGRKDASFSRLDEVWAVFDRDEAPFFLEAVEQCAANGVLVARSNPCFEVWLIQHEADYDRPDDRYEVQRHLKKLRPEYDPAGRKSPDCNCLVDRVEVAEGRASVQLDRRVQEGDEYGRPSTTFGQLTSAIREAHELFSKRQ